MKIVDFKNKKNVFDFFKLQIKRRGGSVIINPEEKTITIFTISRRGIVFYLKDFSDKLKELYQEYEFFYKRFQEKKSSLYEYEEDNFLTPELDSREGFLDSYLGKQFIISIERVLTDIEELIDTKIGFSWQTDGKRISTFYSACVCDALKIHYCKYKEASQIVDCGELVFPCEW